MRRLLVVALVLALVIGLSFAVVAAAVGVRDTIRRQDEEQAAGRVHTVYPGPADCDPAQLEASVQAPASVETGAGATISATVRNKGGDACLLDAGGSRLGAVVASGDKTLWTSTDCPAEPVERRLLIDAGDSTEVSLTWNGATAAASCSGAPLTPSPLPETSATPSPDQTPSPSPEGSAAPSPGDSAAPSPGDSASPGADGSASPGATPSATPTKHAIPNAAPAGTYRVRLQLGGTDLPGSEQTFTVE